ncbi:MAG: TonB-dependent receptor [Hydrogenophilales bacterium]|nr:TonB-dependent receptor [Hydrogenophilales bacterium]
MKLRAIPLMLASVFFTPFAWAAGETGQSLPEMTVSGERPATPANLPNTTYGVTSEGMEQFNVVNTEDALKYTPNLIVRKRYIGDRNAIISVRGTNTRQSARSVVMADGLLLSNFLGSDFSFPPRWSMVSPEEIDRVDVIYGPYSALYPGNSLGSTVLITTKMPSQFTADVKAQAFSQHYDLYGTNDTFNGNQINALIGSRSGALSYLITANRLDNKSQPLSFATLAQSTTAVTGGETVVTGTHSDRDQTGARRVVLGVSSEGIDHTIQSQLKTKFVYDFTPSLQGTFIASYWGQNRDSTTISYLRDASGNPVLSGNVNIDGFRYTIAGATFAPSSGEDARWLYGASLKTRNQTGWNYEAVASLFDVAKDVSRTSSGSGAGAGTVTYGDSTGWRSFDIKADHRPQLMPGSHWPTFGYHYDNYWLNSQTYNASDWQVETLTGLNSAFAGKTETHALFAQDAWQMAEAWKLVLGARHEQWRAYEGSRATSSVNIAYGERKQSNWSPKASLEFAPSDRWLARLSLAKAYRYPTVSELFQGRITGMTLLNNDPNLKPENAFSKDLTFERYYGHGTLRMSLYEEDVNDAIMSQTNTTVSPNVTNIQNIDRVRTRGVEVAYGGTNVFVQGLDINPSVAYNQAKTLENAKYPASEGKYFYRVPLWRANLMVTYRQTPQLSYTFAARHSGRQYNTLDNSDTNPDTFGGTSSYTVFDLKLKYQARKDVTFGFGVENLTDERYFVFHPYPGRTFFAELKAAFE